MNKIETIKSSESHFKCVSKLYSKTINFKWCLRNVSLYYKFTNQEILSPVFRVDKTRYSLGLRFISADGNASDSVCVRLKKINQDKTVHNTIYQINFLNKMGKFFSKKDKWIFSDEQNSSKEMKFDFQNDLLIHDEDSLIIHCEMQVLYHSCERYGQKIPRLIYEVEKSFCFRALMVFLLFFYSLYVADYFWSKNCSSYYLDMHRAINDSACKLLHIAKAMNLTQDKLTSHFFSSFDNYFPRPFNITK